MINNYESITLFPKSVVRDGLGMLLPCFHGTAADISEFDPSFTGKGNDQYGSGFYFTTDYETALGYTTETLKGDDGQPLPKPGGEEHPHVIRAYINLTNPLVIDGMLHSNLRHVTVPNAKVYGILHNHPALFHAADDEDAPNPLGDYFEEFWENEPAEGLEFDRFIHRLADEYFDNTNLLLLDVFFGADYATEYREALHEQLGYDGVIVNFKEEKHVIAWFPEQIHIIENIESES